MDRKKFLAERQWIRNQLAGVADFWLTNGMDEEHGGVYTCLDRGGQIYSTDKSVWMQGRCGWMLGSILIAIRSGSVCSIHAGRTSILFPIRMG